METIIKENCQEKAIITLKGDLDTAAVKDFMSTIQPVINDAGKPITVDFTELNYISSAGMRVLLVLNKNAAEKGGSVAIVGMSENILQIFQMVGFDKMFNIVR
ncbi:MAG: STAS domain-containing protein [Bacteroidales bacterium]|nr:STAS domain-containing protein [Candidatus Physcousia equi]